MKRVLLTGSDQPLLAYLAHTLTHDHWTVILPAPATGAIMGQARENAGPGAAHRLIDQVVARDGPLDALIMVMENAGVADLNSIDERTLDQGFAYHQRAAIMMAQAFAKSSGPGRKGAIIAICGQINSLARSDRPALSVSVNSLLEVTPSLAVALAPDIRFITVVADHSRPTRVDTVVTHTPGRSDPWEKLTRAVMFILDTPSLTGISIALDE